MMPMLLRLMTPMLPHREHFVDAADTPSTIGGTTGHPRRWPGWSHGGWSGSAHRAGWARRGWWERRRRRRWRQLMAMTMIMRVDCRRRLLHGALGPTAEGRAGPAATSGRGRPCLPSGGATGCSMRVASWSSTFYSPGLWLMPCFDLAALAWREEAKRRLGRRTGLFIKMCLAQSWRHGLTVKREDTRLASVSCSCLRLSSVLPWDNPTEA